MVRLIRFDLTEKEALLVVAAVNFGLGLVAEHFQTLVLVREQFSGEEKHALALKTIPIVESIPNNALDA